MNRHRLWAYLSAASALLPAALIVRAAVRDAGGPLPEATVRPLSAFSGLPVDAAHPVARVRRSENLHSILSRGGVPGSERLKITAVFESAYPWPLHEGQPYQLKMTADSSLDEFLLWSRNGDREYSVALHEGGYRAMSRPSSFSKYTTTLTATLTSSLFAAVAGQGEGAELALRFVDLFSWDVNWFVDPRSGDRLSLVYEKFYHQDEFMGYGKILAAAYVNGGRTRTAYHFDGENGEAAYFSAEGRSLRKTFLKAPLAYSRISSRYNPRRLHPVLHTLRAHRGVDYAAPEGTPVKAAADGRVTAAKVQGGLGNCVSLSHGNGYATDYGHLRSFARGLSPGRAVRQGEIVGYVGSTGLATGPHLHYQLSRHGRPLDPLRAAFPSVAHVPESRMPEFDSLRLALNPRLNLEETQYASR